MMLRLFISVNLDHELLAALTKQQDHLKRRLSAAPLRWTRPQDIHLTLKFLGDTDPARLDDILAALQPVVHSHAPFAVTTGGLGCFPSARRPNVLWVGVQDPDYKLQALAAGVDSALVGVGWQPERRPFSGHLTLARVQRSAGTRQRQTLGEMLAELAKSAPLGECHVDALHVMRSQLHPQGATYTSLKTLRLGQHG